MIKIKPQIIREDMKSINCLKLMLPMCYLLQASLDRRLIYLWVKYKKHQQISFFVIRIKMISL